MQKRVISVSNGVTRHPLYRMDKPVDFCLNACEQLAVVGSNLVSDNLRYITFRDSYGDTDGSYYYQQRWNSHDVENIPVVGNLLPQCKDEQLKENIYTLFKMEEMLHKPIILLSSGELRKFQLTKTLLSGPRILIMDNPFIGLDAGTRDLLKSLLEELIKVIGLQVILVLSKSDDIPDFITHVITVENMICGEKIPRSEYSGVSVPEKMLSDEKIQAILDMPYKDNMYKAVNVVKLNKVSIRYGERTILREHSCH